MNRLEETLKQALRREAAPDGFAERVIARAAASGRKATLWSWLSKPLLMRWAAAVAVPAILLAIVQLHTEQRKRAEGELAKSKVMAAMRITAESFESARQKVARATGHEEPDHRVQNPI
jgi:hypothetical protein